MSNQRDHKFTTTKKIAGEDVDFLVTYHMHNGEPVLHGNCTRKDTGAPYPTENWKRQLEVEMREDMLKKALDNQLYEKGDMVSS